MDPLTFDSPHTKAHLLLQAHFSRAPLPIADYLTDTKSVLDQALRILQVSQQPYMVKTLGYSNHIFRLSQLHQCDQEHIRTGN